MEFIITLFFLVLLQAVLGFDNLLYISLESKRVAPDRQAFVRRLGIGLAIGLRIVLLFTVLQLFDSFKDPMFGIHARGFVEGGFTLQAMIEMCGGAFILYTAVKEIFHMLHIHQDDDARGARKPRSVATAVFLIVAMNAVFSFDSILSAMALTKDTTLMVVAIVISGGMMIWLADRVSAFLQKNRMYEILGLFVLFIVGIMLISEGGHHAHLTLFGNPVTPMSKTTFYFVIGILIVIDVVQSKYQKKLLDTDDRAESKEDAQATA